MGLRVVGQVELLDGQLFVVFKAGHQLEPKLEAETDMIKFLTCYSRQGQMQI